ncbi:unnamed protein product [Parascedosporium putredinis]|uniref:Uncharacterized protein n=1 Tax=Parascedosporium putredinis TaxID=1442378 RepID=A0A9P1M7Z6_9PEZI|nr:unnamed protein product [Parascedosporium putredinis]CAI7989217.1 unnamed protein product [Parascedosporium putredinis]
MESVLFKSSGCCLKSWRSSTLTLGDHRGGTVHPPVALSVLDPTMGAMGAMDKRPERPGHLHVLSSSGFLRDRLPTYNSGCGRGESFAKTIVAVVRLHLQILVLIDSGIDGWVEQAADALWQ